MEQQYYKFVEVALPLPIDQNFTYHVPQTMEDMPQIGARILVPFGSTKLTGYVVGHSAFTSLKNIKSIEDILDDKPIVSIGLFRLAKWISEYYICPLGEVLKAMLPSGLNQESKIVISLIPSIEIGYKQLSKKISKNQSEIYQILLKEKKVTLEQLRKKKVASNTSYSISKLEKLGLLKKDLILQPPKAKPKFEKWLRISKRSLDSVNLKEEISRLENEAPKQALCFKILLEKEKLPQKEFLKITGTNVASINSLIKKNLIERFEKETIRSYYSSFNFKTLNKIFLNRDQHRAVKEIEVAINDGFFKTFLLYGVTGSGKTQVYIEVLKKVIAKGRTAIVLVPEISLTPQTVGRFTVNFPNLVAVLHSRMSIGERFDSWRKLKQGELKIAIGPRSAIFAPLENIGLIVVDEEHEPSYKQTDASPLYHARDVAVVRGKLNEAVVILGSATPSVESYYNAKIQKYQLLELPNRIDNIPMPEVTIVDMLIQKSKYPKKKIEIFSKPLQDKISEKLGLDEQIILLQNRRGFSTFIKCHDCGHIEKCINCNITLTYHVNVHRLRCHYCNYIKKAPDVCPKCDSNDILFQGIGTQRVELEIQKRFPRARVIRMDLDTTAQKRSHDRILKSFGQQKYNILLGTQMVAKGHDFDRVSLAGVISADTALLLPDFRASERTFQLLTQVAGRAGRKNFQGEVIIQTYSPNNYGIVCTKTHDFIKFFANEIQQRRDLNYPPFSRLIQVLVKGENEQQVISIINEFKAALPDDENLFQVLGPVSSPISKIQNYYRWHLILKINKKSDPSGKFVNRIIKESLNKIKNYIKREK
ncbi:MAG: primosomal protein N', partial [Candidatus Hodarchaeota archaeon]